jgi:hypothetical protein
VVAGLGALIAWRYLPARESERQVAPQGAAAALSRGGGG